MCSPFSVLRWMLQLTLVALCAVLAAGGSCDLSVNPVVGKDGLVYQNPCIAKAQGQDIQADTTEKVVFPYASRASLITTGSVPTSEITRFGSAGFSFVGRIKLKGGKAAKLVGDSRSVAQAADASPKPTQLITRVSRKGYLWISTSARTRAILDQANTNAQTSQGISPAGLAVADDDSEVGGRKLQAINGVDNRFRTTSTSFPYSAMTWIVTGCSGALITGRSVLTAGNCVYDHVNKRFYRDLDMYVNRRNGVGGQKFDWRYVTTVFNNAKATCCQGQCNCITFSDVAKYDYAVIQYRNNPGNTYGALQYGYVCPTQTYTNVNRCGYPSDKSWYPSLFCHFGGSLGGFNACNSADGAVTSTLDWASGDGGSPIWVKYRNGQRIIRGVVATKSWASVITKKKFDNIFGWT